MNLEISYAMFGAKPPVTKPVPEFYVEVGEEGIREITKKHYAQIVKSEIAFMFPKDEKGLQKAIKNASDFFIQICGGPDYFNLNRGEPIMIQRHARFGIDARSREVWLELFKPILGDLKESGVTQKSIESFWKYLDVFSLWMINTK